MSDIQQNQQKQQHRNIFYVTEDRRDVDHKLKLSEHGITDQLEENQEETREREEELMIGLLNANKIRQDHYTKWMQKV